MKNKPVIFNFLSIIYFLIAISIPIQIMIIYGHHLASYELIYHKLSLFNMIVMVLSLYNSFALYHAKKSLRYSIPLNILFIIVNNYFVSFVGVDYSSSQTLLASFSIISVSSFLFFSSSKKIISNPDLIWWKWARRTEKSLPVTIMLKDQELYTTNTFDLSRTGAYLQYASQNDNKPSVTTTKILKGETLEFIIGEPDSKNRLTCKAKVVRKAESSGTYPDGIGICFEDLSMKNSLTLMKLIHGTQIQI